MATKLCLVRLAVYGPGEDDLKNIRPVSAEMEMWAIDTMDFCGMGTRDPKGKSWHVCDWGSNDGVYCSKSFNMISIWLAEDQVPLWAMDITRGPYEAWQKIKDIPGALIKIPGRKNVQT